MKTKNQPMKVIVAGSRSVVDREKVFSAISFGPFLIGELVSGCARGVDQLGEEWALVYKVPVQRFPADWQGYGRRAGPIRNERMARYADALIAVWDGESRGTDYMIRCMVAEGKPVYIHPAVEQ